MPERNLVLRNGNVVSGTSVVCSDVAIADGTIVAIAPNSAGSFAEEIDCSGLHIFPGCIDAHVHFNEPGRTEWEGLASGSRAVAAGGGTCFFDMPLNSNPPVLDATAFDAKQAAAERQSVTDFAIWGGLTPLNLDRLPELRIRGAIGFKAFMSDSGIAEFPRSDSETLRKGMEVARELGSVIAVHAESEELTKALTAERRTAGRSGIRDFIESRPIAAELEAIEVACDLAGETGCELHIVHVSSEQGVELVRQYRARGVDVSCETCPHYLVLSEDDLLKLGPVAKCAPPVRTSEQRDALVAAVRRGEVDTMGSDHSPSAPELKGGADFFAVWGGIAGAQHLAPLMIDLFQREESPNWPLLAQMLASNVARRFHLPETVGEIAVGAEANLMLVDLGATQCVTKEELHYRHPITPYAGRSLRGKVVRTLLRGQTIARDGQASGAPAGRLVVPISA